MPYPIQGEQTNFSGTIDGQNTRFQTEHPCWPGSVRVYLNGMKQEWGHDYYEVESGTIVQIAEPPEVGDHLIIDYVKLTLQEGP